MRKSKIVSEGGSLGMAGGFNTGAGAASRGKGAAGGGNGGDIIMGEDEGDGYESNDDRKAGVLLTTQTLGGRIVPPAEGDPVYMLGAFRDSECLLEFPRLCDMNVVLTGRNRSISSLSISWSCAATTTTTPSRCAR